MHRAFPRQRWSDILLRVKDRIKRDRLPIIAAGVAFYGLLAVFPALAAMVAVFGLVASPEQVEAQLAMFGGMLPPQAAEVLLGQVRDLTQTDARARSASARSAAYCWRCGAPRPGFARSWKR